MKFWKTLVSVALFAVFATSCGGDEDILHDNYLEQDYTGCFNVISKKGVDVISEGTTYMFRWRSDYTADVYIRNAKFSKMMPDGIDIAFEGLKWGYINEVKTIYEKNIVPTSVKMKGVAMNDVSSYVLDELNIGVLERRLMDANQGEMPVPEYMPVINVSMKMGDVEVVTVQKQRFYFGTIGVVNASDEIYYPKPLPFYLVSLNPTTGLATLDIYQAKFAEKMPAMDMKMKDIPFEVSTTGCKFAIDEVIPTIKDVPYENYLIKNMSGAILFASGMDLRFNCMDYAVSAQLGFPIKLE